MGVGPGGRFVRLSSFLAINHAANQSAGQIKHKITGNTLHKESSIDQYAVAMGYKGMEVAFPMTITTFIAWAMLPAIQMIHEAVESFLHNG